MDVSDGGKSYLFIQPTDGHWNTTFPLIGVLLSEGWHVTLCSSRDVCKVVKGRLNNELLQNLSYAPLSSRTFLRLDKPCWTIVHFGPRLLEQKDSKNERLKARLSRTCFALAVLIFLNALPSTTKVVFESHQKQSITSPALRARKNSVARIIERLGKRLLKKRISAYCVYGSTVRDAIVFNPRLPLTHPVLLGPSVLCVGQNEMKTHQAGIKIVIPGRVDQRRRDYEWIKQIPKENRGKISLFLLGRAQRKEDHRIIEMVKELGFVTDPELNGFYVSQRKYDDLCKSADVMVAPVRKNFGARKIGHDTITGVVLDAAFFGKKCLVPEEVEIDDQYKDLLVRYSNAESLALLIDDLSQNVSERFELSEAERIVLEGKAHAVNKDFSQQLLALGR